jgi:hypothetical protein
MRSALHYPASTSTSSGGFVESARTAGFTYDSDFRDYDSSPNPRFPLGYGSTVRGERMAVCVLYKHRCQRRIPPGKPCAGDSTSLGAPRCAQLDRNKVRLRNGLVPCLRRSSQWRSQLEKQSDWTFSTLSNSLWFIPSRALSESNGASHKLSWRPSIGERSYVPLYS